MVVVWDDEGVEADSDVPGYALRSLNVDLVLAEVNPKRDPRIFNMLATRMLLITARMNHQVFCAKRYDAIKRHLRTLPETLRSMMHFTK